MQFDAFEKVEGSSGHTAYDMVWTCERRGDLKRSGLDVRQYEVEQLCEDISAVTWNTLHEVFHHSRIQNGNRCILKNSMRVLPEMCTQRIAEDSDHRNMMTISWLLDKWASWNMSRWSSSNEFLSILQTSDQWQRSKRNMTTSGRNATLKLSVTDVGEKDVSDVGFCKTSKMFSRQRKSQLSFRWSLVDNDWARWPK